MNKKTKKIFLGALIVGLTLLVFYVLPKPMEVHKVQALSDNEELEKLDRKEEKYQRLINLKQQQQTTLGNQLKLMDVQVQGYERGIETAHEELERNNQEIERLEDALKKKQVELDKTKETLSESILLYYQLDQEMYLKILSEEDEFKSAMNQTEFLEQTSGKVQSILKDVEEGKRELGDQKKVYDEKADGIEQQKEDLEEKVYYLNNEKNSKRVLLAKTEGEEVEYQKMLERVEKQKQELIGDVDALSDEKRAELNKILAKAPKPKSGTASTKWYYSQKDSRWANKRIGLSSSLMKDYGCAVTALSMVFTYYDEKISPGKLSSQPIFYQDLIVWPGSWKGVDLKSSIHHGNISWSTVKKNIKKDKPVIVFVRSGTGAGHYVVIHGRDKNGEYVVHDPLFGPNIYLDTTQKLVGAIYNTSTTIDQMIIYDD